MNILYYYPSNKRAVGFDTIFVELMKRGHKIHLLTTCEEGLLHEDVKKLGVQVHANPVTGVNSILYHLKQWWYLVRFCHKYQINYVFSHLQPVNIIAVIAQFFVRAKVIIFRHHFRFDLFIKGASAGINRNEVLGEKIVNLLARKIIVPSSGVYLGMQEFETVSMDKVRIIPYIYDFSKYKKPDPVRVKEIRAQYSSHLLLIMCSRFVPLKRHEIAFRAFHQMISDGLDIKVLVLDDGPEKEKLQKYVIENKLQDRIVFVGYTTEILNFMAASDLLIHPSLTEASNSVVKEMGILEKPVAVCEGVGDFSDYIIDQQNGFLLPKADTDFFIQKAVKQVYLDKEVMYALGRELKATVVKEFSVSNETMAHYEVLLNGQ